MKHIYGRLLAVLPLLFICQILTAQNNWDGDNAIGEFILCNNWFGNTCPTTWNSTTDLNIQLKNSGFQTTMYLNYGAWIDLNNLTYFATYNPSVNQFDADGPIGNENGINFYGKIENYSPNNTQVFNLPFHGRNASVIEINPINGGFTFNRPIYNSGNKNFNVRGANSKKLTLNSYPAGNGSVGLYIKQYSIVEVNYNNPASLSGGYFVEEGELWVNSAGVIQGPIQVGNGTVAINKLYISHASTATTVANNITVPASSANATIGGLNTSNTHTYSGNINLNNNTVNFDEVSAGGSVNFSGVISGTGNLLKIGAGLIRLSNSNTYTGTTTVNAGTLQYGAANAISNSSNVILNGGKFSTGATTGYSDTVGTLNLTANSTIELGTGTHTLNFANSSAVVWTAGQTLTITGWTNSCSGAKVFVGTDNTGLTATQLSQITFQGYGAGASISPVGELIPGNIVLTATGGTLLAKYSTLKAAFDAMNLSTHIGVINISVLNDINEGANTALLKQMAGITSVLIQPGGCGPRTITGTGTGGSGAPLVDLDGADNVTIDGLNANGNSLTISNTSTSATSGTSTIRFQTDATNNIITNCSVLGSASMAANVNGGNIWFGANSTGGGNDNNTVSNCNIGPAGANLPSKAIYFSGSNAPNQNSGIVINNNNIYDFFNAGVESAGIYVGPNGNTSCSFTNNKFYQSAARTQTTATPHTGIRIATGATGNSFVITGNAIGYSSSSGTGSYVFNGINASSFLPINLSSVGTTASTVQGNTIAGITLNISATASSAFFQGISCAGSSTVNVTSNVIGIPSAPIVFNATNSNGGTIYAINLSGSGSMNVQGNTIQSITATSTLAGPAFTVIGISLAGTAIYTATNNTLGNSVAANSFNIGAWGISTGASNFTGITATSTGSPVTIGSLGAPNVIQNVILNANANNVFQGITASTVANVSIDYNSISGVRFDGTTSNSSSFRGISSSATGGNITITNNTLGTATSDLVTYAAVNTALCTAISVATTGVPVNGDIVIQYNDIRGIVNTVAATTAFSHTFISNTASTTSQNISFNTFTNLNINSTGTVVFIGNYVAATISKTINSNSIVGTFNKAGASGSVILYNDYGASAAGIVINNNSNNFSNITVSGTTTITGWLNTDGASPYPTKTINNNTFSNWSLGSGNVVAMSLNNLGGTSSVSTNTISGISSSGTVSGINLLGSGAATSLSVNNNSISSLSGSSTVGISGAQPAGTLTLNINSNTISNLSSSTTTAYAIFDGSACPTKNISSNNINSISSNNGTIATAITSSNGTAVTIDNNTIANVSSTATAIVTAISVNSGSAIGVNNNIISSLSSANNGNFRGILVSLLGATSNTITGNSINGMTSTSTGASASVRGIEVQGTNSGNINSNSISNINTTTTNVGIGTSAAVVGLYYGSSGASSNINDNTISSINATSTSAINVSVAGLITSSTTSGGTIARNKIYNITNATTGTTNSTFGCYPNGGNWTFANNMISLMNNQTVQAFGIYDNGAAGARKYYYNSIYIGGTHGGTHMSAAMQYNAPATAGPTVDIKNNILVNERNSSGKNYAFANTSTTFTGMTMNYNVLNTININLVAIFNTTDESFADWKIDSNLDGNSLSGVVVPFANTAIADLHITTTCNDLESTGTPVTVTTDYDGVTRNVTTPDIGADEFSGSTPAAITLSPATLTVCAGSGIAITASSTDATYAYTWSPATGLSATSGATITATPTATTTYTVTGTSPSGCTKTKSFVVTVNPLPTAITVSPSSVNSCPNIIQTLTVTPNPSTMIPIGTPNSNVAVVGNTPYRQKSSTIVRIQFLVTKAELNAAGITNATNLKSISFNVTSAGTGAMPAYDISLGHTASAALTTTFINTGLTTLYNGVNILPVNGINTYTFSTPFAWNGTSNIVINICHTATGNGGNPFSLVTLCTPATISTTSKTAAGSCAAVSGTTNGDKPVIYFEVDAPITWSPITNLYTDALATIAYNPAVHTNMPTIYAKPTVATTYTASVTNTVTNCASTSTGSITMNPNIWNGTIWSLGPPSGTTNLQFTGNFTTSSNLSGCNCSVTGGAVVFNDPATLTLSGGLNVSGGSLTFMNNASLLQTNDSSTNSGTVTIERITQPMYRYDYTYWGCPVTLASAYTLGMLSPTTQPDKYYSWIPTVSNAAGTWQQESTATVMDPRKGYIVRAPQTFSTSVGSKVPYTANFSGTPNNGVISSPILHGALALGAPEDKYNLLGNPYPSALDAQAFLTDLANTPVIDGTIYFWTHNSPIGTLGQYPNPFYGSYAYNYTSNDYAGWNSLGAVGFRGIQASSGGAVPNGFISVGQGFFAKSTGTAASPTPVTFKNSMRVAGNNSQFFRHAAVVENHRFWLDLIDSSSSFSQVLIGYKDDATVGWDRMYDGSPMDEGAGMTLYSIIPDRHLSIQGRPLPFDAQDQVVLGYKATHTDSYSFGLDGVEGLFENQNIYIEDKQLNIIHDLKQSPYVFTSEAGVFNDRFVLRYNNTALSNIDFDEQNVSVGVIQHELFAQSNTRINTIEMFDITGKLIARYEPQSNQFKTLFNFARGVYLARVTLDNGKVSSKKIMN